MGDIKSEGQRSDSDSSFEYNLEGENATGDVTQSRTKKETQESYCSFSKEYKLNANFHRIWVWGLPCVKLLNFQAGLFGLMIWVIEEINFSFNVRKILLPINVSLSLSPESCTAVLLMFSQTWLRKIIARSCLGASESWFFYPILVKLLVMKLFQARCTPWWIVCGVFVYQWYSQDCRPTMWSVPHYLEERRISSMCIV